MGDFRFQKIMLSQISFPMNEADFLLCGSTGSLAERTLLSVFDFSVLTKNRFDLIKSVNTTSPQVFKENNRQASVFILSGLKPSMGIDPTETTECEKERVVRLGFDI